MIKLFILLFCVFTANLFCSGQEIKREQNLLIIVPRVVEAKQKLNVFIFLSKKYVHTLNFELVAKDGLSNSEPVKTVKTRLNYNVERVSFDLLNFENQNLTLHVTSQSINKSVDIVMIPKLYFTTIQTDKSVYKPGDLINFRLFLINDEGKGFAIMGHDKLKDIDVRLIAPNGDEVYRWIEEFEPKVYSFNYRLGENTRFGEFSICAKLTAPEVVDEYDQENKDDEIFEDHCKSIRVEKYVSPSFEVILKHQNPIALDQNIDLKVSAKYAFGKYLKGIISITATAYSLGQNKKTEVEKIKEDPVRMKENFQHFKFSPTKHFNLTENGKNYSIEFEVKFQNIDTKKIEVKNTTIYITKSKIKLINLETESKYAKENRLKDTKFEVKASMIDFDDKPMTNIDCQPKLKFSFFYPYGPESLNYSPTKNKDGTYTFVVTIDAKTDFRNPLTFKCVCGNRFVKKVVYFERSTYSGENLEITLLKKIYKVGEKANILGKNIDGSLHNVQLYVMLINNNGKAAHNLLALNQNELHKSKFSFSIDIRNWMIPILNVIVFYQHRNGEIIFDGTKIDIDPRPSSKVSIELNDTITYKPGSRIDLKFITEKSGINETSLHVLGVDKKVEFMGRSNEINVENYITEIFKLKNSISLRNVKSEEDPYYKVAEFNAFFLTNANISKATSKTETGGIQLPQFGDKTSLVTTRESNEDDDDDDLSDLFDSTVREDFQETFLFWNKENPKAIEEINKKLPDSISSFRFQAFTFNPDKGIGIAKDRYVTVFRNFFIEVYLPYSIHVGELLQVEVVVFNYVNNKPLNVEITMSLSDSNSIAFINADGNESEFGCNITELDKNSMTNKIKVKENSSKPTYFYIKAKKFGSFLINFKGTGGDYVDELVKTLLVEPNGVLIRENIPFSYNFKTESIREIPFNDKIQSKIPRDNFHTDTIKIELNIYGNLLGKALLPAEKLIYLPTDQYDQEFYKWIPNIIAIKYLKSVDQLTPELEKNVLNNILQGFQKIKQIVDSSKNDKRETGQSSVDSVWFAAYVSKLLNLAKDVVDKKESKMIEKTIDDLLGSIASCQKENGEFFDNNEDYVYFGKNTEKSHNLTLTAFVLINFLESSYKEKYKETIDKSLKYIKEQTVYIQSNYEIAITTYALSLLEETERKNYDNYLTELIGSAVDTGNKMFWENDIDRSLKIQTASYGAMAILNFNQSESEVQVSKTLKWLITQRNGLDGFYSTTDTIIGLQALSKIYDTYDRNPEMKVKVKADDQIQPIFIDRRSAKDIHTISLPENIKNMQLEVTGKGILSGNLLVSFYALKTGVETNSKETNFNLQVQPYLIFGKILNLKITVSFKKSNIRPVASKTIVEIKLPSGFAATSEKEVKEDSLLAGVEKVELLRENTLINLYFGSLDEKPKVLEIAFERLFKTKTNGESTVRVYEYYYSSTNTMDTTVFYNLEANCFK